MATETLRPDSPGDECNLARQTGCSACPDHYDCVDEVVADEDTTTVNRDQDEGTFARDLYNLTAPTGVGTINSVTVWARCTVPGKGVYEQLKIALKSGATAESSAAKVVTIGWANYSETWALNPDTSAAFTWAEIASLQAGVELRGIELKTGVKCTQVWVVVDYTLPPVPPLPTPARLANPLINRGLFRRHPE